MTTNIRVQAKKSLGQNFLVNPGVLDRIVLTAAVGPNDAVLEVGPGTGALTERLAASGARVIAVEKDRRLIDPLREKFKASPNVEIIEDDILSFDPSAYELRPASYKLVANIPYYLTAHLIRLAAETWPTPSVAVLMVQEEVAHRIVAKPGDMNLLALSVQLYGTPSVVMRVSRNSFRPVPNVDSAVIQIDFSSDQTLRAQNERILAVARKAFGQKRKQLKSSVPSEALLKAGIPLETRPQELSIDQWRQLAAALP